MEHRYNNPNTSDGDIWIWYCLFGGQLGIWSYIVITKIITSSYHGDDLLTLSYYNRRFLSLDGMPRIFYRHYFMAMVTVIFIIMHIVYLHLLGSTGTLAISSRADIVSIYRLVLVKDMYLLCLTMCIPITSIPYYPYIYVSKYKFYKWKPRETPPIMPEWYLLTYHGISKIIAHKSGGLLWCVMSIAMLFYWCNDDYISFESGQSYQSTKRSLIIMFYAWMWIYIANASAYGMPQKKCHKHTSRAMLLNFLIPWFLETNTKVHQDHEYGHSNFNDFSMDILGEDDNDLIS